MSIPLNALGLPAPQGPTVPQPEQALQMLQLAAKYLLYERAEQTQLSQHFASVCAERHEHFHAKHIYLEGPKKGERVPFAECSNRVCEDARKIIANAQKKEIFINPLGAQLMSGYVLNFMPTPQNIRFWIEEKKVTPSLSNASKIVLTD